MNLRWTRRWPVLAGALGLSLFVLSCTGQDSAGGGDSPGALAVAEGDAAVLGQEIYGLVDRAMSYRTSHRGRSPRSLRELGIDELTPATERSLRVVDGRPEVTVKFRETEGHTILSCTGASSILEEATVEGKFSLTCDAAGGGKSKYQVGR